MKYHTKKQIFFILTFLMSMGIAQAAEDMHDMGGPVNPSKETNEISAPATGIITYTVIFNNDTNDDYLLVYPALGKAYSSGGIKCCTADIKPTTCLSQGLWFKGTVHARKSVTLICPTYEPASPHILRSFAPSRYLSFEVCSVKSRSNGNNQVNSSTCHVHLF